MPNQWPPSSTLPDILTESDRDLVSGQARPGPEPVDGSTWLSIDPEQSRWVEGSRHEAAEGWGWIELFVAIQLLWGLLLFVPGMQPLRVYIRALPYVTSLGALVFYMRRGTGEPLAASTLWLFGVFGLLALNLLHEETHLLAGIAQVIFQVSIAAPMFWVPRAVRSEARFLRLLWVIFAASFVSAAIGVLQVYYPDQFMPPEFSALGRALNPELVHALTYTGADGREIIRPPGLSDLPGGAAISGLTTVVLGIALAIHGHRRKILRALCFAAAPIGMTALYLTQVRSFTVMAVLSVWLFAAMRLRQGRIVQGGWIVIASVGLVAASFMWAATLGGESLSERFSGLTDTGFFTTFQENRGLFIRYTLDELLFKYPWGAGLGRWGMMHVYFGDASMWQAPPIHVEIQMTGWLLDGGVLMWVLYGSALVSALRFGYLLAIRGVSDSFQSLATIVLSLQVTIIGLCLTGPVFNTQLGVEFWTVTAALFGAAQGWQEMRTDGEGGEDGER